MFCSAFEDCAVVVGSVGGIVVSLGVAIGGLGVKERAWMDGGPDILVVFRSWEWWWM